MKILWLSHLIPYPPKAGVLQRCYYLLKELGKYHEIDLMAFTQKDLLLSFYQDYDVGLSEARNALLKVVNDIEFLEIPSEESIFGKHGLAAKGLFSQGGYTMNWLRSDVFVDHLKARLSENNYDLVHFDTISLAVYRKYVKGVSVTLDHHNIESHMMLRRATKESNLFKKFYFYQEGLKIERQEKKYATNLI